MAEQECHEEVSRRGELQPCDKVAVAMRFDPTFGDPYPVCAFHARGANMMSLSAVEAAVRADMQREVQTVEYRAVAMYPETKDVVDSAAVAPSVEDALNSAEVFGLAESNADIPNLIIGVERRTKAGPWLPVTPSTINQTGAEQK